MTTRSTRERADQRLIDAAYKYRNAECDRVHPDYAYQVAAAASNLLVAVDQHEQLGLAPLSPRAAQSNNSTDTSAEAGASLGDVSGLARTCFDEIVLAGGLTVFQLTQVLGREHQTVSARVNDLMRKGWCVDSGLRRKTGSGRNAIVWKPSALALKETQ